LLPVVQHLGRRFEGPLQLVERDLTYGAQRDGKGCNAEIAAAAAQGDAGHADVGRRACGDGVPQLGDPFPQFGLRLAGAGDGDRAVGGVAEANGGWLLLDAGVVVDAGVGIGGGLLFGDNGPGETAEIPVTVGPLQSKVEFMAL
jgi:hypothetical protein